MNVLMLTRRVDRDDWLAGFAHGWVKRIAEHPRVDRLDVICLELGSTDLPENVRVTSMGKERGANRLTELWNFQKAIRKIIGDIDVIFGHMIPRYTLVAAPWALLYGVPVVQWYTHRQVTPELRIVHALARRILTASPESFTLPSNKVTVLGHGIDLSHFHEAENPPESRLVASIGRLSPIKHYEALIAATAELTRRPGYEDVRVAIAGGTTPQNGEVYAQELRTLAQNADVADRIEFLGPIPHEQISTLYQLAAVTVNLCPTGGVDKAVLESMASSVPVIVRNQTFLPLLGDDAESLWVSDLDPAAIADKLAAVLDATTDQRLAIGKRLAARVRTEYDLDQLIDRLVTVLEETSRKRRESKS